MVSPVFFRFACFVVAISPSQLDAQDAGKPFSVTSPKGQLEVICQLDRQGRLSFTVDRGDTLMMSGTLSLEFANSDALGENMRVVGARQSNRDDTYAVAVGKTSRARDQHRELILALEESGGLQRKLDIAFRVFDDGVAFRYEIPAQKHLTDFVLTEERTSLEFAGNPNVTFLNLKNYTSAYETYYKTARLANVSLEEQPLIGLPILIERSGGTWMAFTEAGLTDYAGAYLTQSKSHSESMEISLSPLPEHASPDGSRPGDVKVVGRTPFHSPWRLLMIADDLAPLIESDIVFHLNEPSRIEDTSWIKPGKTTFPWWNRYVLGDDDLESAGVNTATMKHYIDFCAQHRIPYHSLDGLDIAWYGGPIRPDGPTDVTTAAPSIDMPELLRYAEEKGVRLRLWMHWEALKPQLDEAFETYQQWGIEGVMIDFMNRDDQEMVRWYHEVARKAAEHQLTVTWHGAYKPTGMGRTWPNVLSYEAVLNQEYNKWSRGESKGTPPRHNLDVAFIRMLAGPLDYHQGGMRSVLPGNFQFRSAAPFVQGTRGHQLAMYVVYQNHLSMMADYPAAYRQQPGLDFLVNIPATWDETRVIKAEFGRCIVIARRSGKHWYLGGMTADDPCQLDLPLAFLGVGVYEAKLWLDDAKSGPTSLRMQTEQITSTDTIEIEMPRYGGFVAKLHYEKP